MGVTTKLKAAKLFKVIKVAEAEKLRQADVVAAVRAHQLHNATLALGPAHAGDGGVSFHFHMLHDGMVHFAEEVAASV